ncbi:FecR family protein [Sphingobacterium sp. LRF_L2]|uniref:FecR family protein n=1 Tax=Sphingobacterium sp. LRF_L2 TaxID=3369421 RepID=UPI003F5E62AF
MNPTFVTYKDFKAVDFFQDPAFATAVLSPQVEDDRFWEDLAGVYPYLRVEMDAARSWILLVRQQPVYQGKTSSAMRWERIQDRLPVYARQQNRAVRIKRLTTWSARIAALFLAVLFIYEVSQFGTKSANTNFGERREVLLPDESKINLNSNSSLSYVRDWKSDKPREVWMNGEAMFEVKHTAILNRLRESDHFIVHVGDLALTVLGTKFNVKERRGRIEVSLFEGSVRITTADGLDKVMTPGEVFIYDQEEKTDQLVKQHLSKAGSWMRGELEMEHASLSNLIEVLEDNYGYQVVLEDSSLLEKHLTGVIPLKSIDDILFVVKHTMNVNIQKNNKQITINSN